LALILVRKDPKLPASIISTVAASAGEVEGRHDAKQLLSAFLCVYCINFAISVFVVDDAVFRSKSDIYFAGYISYSDRSVSLNQISISFRVVRRS
jgi:hypothetical protein